MLTTYGLPALHWARHQVARFHAYLDRFVAAVDPGEDDW